MKNKHILFAWAIVGALASCSSDDNKEPVYNNLYSNPLTNYSAADPTVWKEMIIHFIYTLPIHQLFVNQQI